MSDGGTIKPVPGRMTLVGLMWFVSAGLAVCGVVGCGDNSDEVTRESGSFEPKVSYLAGVAIPPGFELQIDDGDTWDRESGGERFAQHVYEGTGDVYKIRNFYRDKMPALGWSLVEDQIFDGEVTIRFEKEKEACVVRISAGGLFGNDITIKAFVAPFSRGTQNLTPRRVP